MRSSHTIALCLNGFHLLSLVPCIQQSEYSPRLSHHRTFVGGEGIGDEPPATDLDEGYFANGGTYEELLRHYESSDAYHVPEICLGRLEHFCASRSVRSILQIFTVGDE